MSFAPTFGSLGDFISTATLIINISRALSDSKGSKSDYHALVRDLDVLKTAVAHVERLHGNFPQTRELGDLRVACETSVRRCREQIEAFFAEIGKYEAALRPAGTKNRVTSAIAKLRWMQNRDNFRRIKENLMQSCETLNLHLSTTANHVSTIGMVHLASSS